MLRTRAQSCNSPVPLSDGSCLPCWAHVEQKARVMSAYAHVLPCPQWQGEPCIFLAGMEVKLTQRTKDVKI